MKISGSLSLFRRTAGGAGRRKGTGEARTLDRWRDAGHGMFSIGGLTNRKVSTNEYFPAGKKKKRKSGQTEKLGRGLTERRYGADSGARTCGYFIP